MIKFSIIIPSHNGQKYINRCLTSIIHQTYSNYEIIFINDSSADNTSEIIHSNYPDIRYYEVDFCDLSKSRNYGVSKVKGDFIIFVDIDDWIEKDLLKNLSMQNPKNDLIRYQAIMVDDNKKVYEKFITNEFLCVDGMKALNFFASNFEIYSPSWLYAYNYKFWKKYRFKFPEGKSQEDFALTSLILSKAKCVSSIPYIGYNYYKSTNSIMRNGSYKYQLKKAYDILEHCDNFYNTIILKTYDEVIRKNLVNYYLSVIEHKIGLLKYPEKEYYKRQYLLRKKRW